MSAFIQKHKLLILSSGFPYPVDVGRKAVLAGFVKFAVDSVGAENVLLLCVSSDRSEEAAAALSPCRVVFFRPASAPLRMSIAAIQALLLRRRAIQEALVAAPAAAGRIRRAIEDFGPDTILIDTIRMVQHLPREMLHRSRCVLYLDDLYSLRYQRTLEAMQRHPEVGIDPVGTFARFLPALLRGLAHGRALQRRLLALESTIVGAREREMPGLFTKVLLLNDAEARRFSEETGAGNITAIKPLLKNVGGGANRRFSGRPSFLFLGNLRYSANAYGLSLFLHQAMPQLLDAQPDAELLVAGAGAGAELKEIGSRFGPRVRLLEYVEDLDALMSSCAGMIVPLAFGTGIKIKVIDALSRGVPLVSTPWGIDGLDLADGVHCLIENEVSAFPSAMSRLLDPGLNARLSEAGLAYFNARLSPAVVCEDYRAAILGCKAAQWPDHAAASWSDVRAGMNPGSRDAAEPRRRASEEADLR